MKFPIEVQDYLSGEKFSNGLQVKISQPEGTIPTRIEHLENICREKKVIHVGCVDHLPLISQKIKQNTWLHKRLCNAATRCVGIDTNQDGISYLKDHLGYSDVYCANILTDSLAELKNEHWDIMLLGELLEHINNPVEFLEAIRKKYSKCVDQLVITVPNAFYWENFKDIFQHKETINTDHRFWFTPYTLSKIAIEAGFDVNDFIFCESYLTPTDRFFKYVIHAISPRRWLLRRFPGFRRTLIMHAFTRRES